MDMSTRQKLAALIQRDIDQLREKAEGQGVTAWLGRPVQRERPNERFLQRTLRSVQAHNQRAQEEEMWERHLQRRQREEEELQQRTELRGRNSSHSEGRRRRARASSLERSESQGRSCSPSCSGGEGSKRRRSTSRERSCSSSSGSSDEEGMTADGRKRQRGQSPSGGVKSWRSAGRGGQDKEEVAVSRQDVAAYEGSEDVSDDAIAAMIASKRSRGRGGSGARSEMPGPYLSAGEVAGRELENEDTELVRRQQLGPNPPDWLQRQRQQQEEEERKLLAMAASLQRGSKRRKELRNSKQRRRRSGSEGSSSGGGSSDNNADSDSDVHARRRHPRKEKRKKKEKKRKAKEKKAKRRD